MKHVRIITENEFKLLFDEYWHQLHAFAFNILREKQAAEDCIQNFFIDYWKRSDSVEILNTKAYLFQAVKYQCAKTLVAQKRFNYGVDLTGIISEPQLYAEEKNASRTGASSGAKISILDVTGRILHHFYVETTQGGRQEILLDPYVKNLQTGRYFLKINEKTESFLKL